MTDDSFKSIKIAIGGVTVNNRRVYGIAAPLLCGMQIISENMQIANKNNTLTMGIDGFIAESTNGYKLQINPDEPNKIFTIQRFGDAILGVDAVTNKFVFKGTLESKDGHIGGFTIADTTLISGDIGMSSDATSGAIAYWAGSKDRNNAPYRVSNTGALVCSNATITGGSLSIGQQFKVTNDGKLTCSGADITGKVTATSGKIGGWIIDGNSLVGTKGASYIKGGSIDIGSGLFSADDDAVYMGNFYVQSGRRGMFSSENQMVGMMSSASGNNQAWLWAGNNAEPYPFCVTGAGETYIRRVANTTDWDGYSLDRIIDYIWSNGTYGLKALREDIDSIDSSSDE